MKRIVAAVMAGLIAVPVWACGDRIVKVEARGDIAAPMGALEWTWFRSSS